MSAETIAGLNTLAQVLLAVLIVVGTVRVIVDMVER